MWNPGQPPFGAAGMAGGGGYGASSSSWNNAPMENQWTNYYQTMPASQVDWAALAQQWFAMKGSQPAPPAPPVIQSTPVPPPPPPISYHFQAEGGVANMDLEEDEEIDLHPEEKVDHHHHSGNHHRHHRIEEEVPTKYHHQSHHTLNHQRRFYNQSNWKGGEKNSKQ